MKVEFVKDFNLFLEKAEYGTNHTYQLHRELGGVFVEASFVDESLHILFKTRIEADLPQFVSSVLKWDDNCLPYEMETYLIGGEEVVVPFYRPMDAGWRSFLLDITEAIKEAVETHSISKCCQLSDEVGVPHSIAVKINCMLQKICVITKFLNTQKQLLDDMERQTIDRHFGECGLWEALEEDTTPALATYLGSLLADQAEEYKRVSEIEMEKRRNALIEAEGRIVSNLENSLKSNKFKKGYVS